MNSLENREKKEKIYRLGLFMGEILLKNGGETWRVERLCRELCSAKGFSNASIFVTPTVLIIGDDRSDGITFIKTLKVRTINLDKVAKANKIALAAIEDKDLDVEKFISELKVIENSKTYNENLKLLMVGVASAAFAMLFEISFQGAVFTFIISIIGLMMSRFIERISTTSVLGTIMGSFFIGVSALYLRENGYAPSSSFIIIGSILPLLPGVAITKSISDLV